MFISKNLYIKVQKLEIFKRVVYLLYIIIRLYEISINLIKIQAIKK